MASLFDPQRGQAPSLNTARFRRESQGIRGLGRFFRRAEHAGDSITALNEGIENGLAKVSLPYDGDAHLLLPFISGLVCGVIFHISRGMDTHHLIKCVRLPREKGRILVIRDCRRSAHFYRRSTWLAVIRYSSPDRPMCPTACCAPWGSPWRIIALRISLS